MESMQCFNINFHSFAWQVSPSPLVAWARRPPPPRRRLASAIHRVHNLPKTQAAEGV
jgi:hypothetical protein